MGTPREDAENTVTYLAVGGIVVLVLGWVLATTQWQVDRFGDHRNTLLAVVGFVLAAVGQIAVLIAIVAYGARLGVRWSGLLDPDTPEPSAAERSYLDEDGL